MDNEKNSSLNFSIKLLLKVIIAIIIIVGIVLLIQKNIKRYSPVSLEPPKSLEIPLYNNKKIVKVEKDEAKKWEIVFLSSYSSPMELVQFYRGWAASNNFVFVDKGDIIENKQDNKTNNNQIQPISVANFSLVPGLGKTSSYNYNVSVNKKTQNDEAEVSISYLEIEKTGEDLKNNVLIPKKLKLKL